MSKKEQMKSAICGLVNMICFPTLVELFLPAVGIVKEMTCEVLDSNRSGAVVSIPHHNGILFLC